MATVVADRSGFEFEEIIVENFRRQDVERSGKRSEPPTRDATTEWFTAPPGFTAPTEEHAAMPAYRKPLENQELTAASSAERCCFRRWCS